MWNQDKVQLDRGKYQWVGTAGFLAGKYQVAELTRAVCS